MWQIFIFGHFTTRMQQGTWGLYFLKNLLNKLLGHTLAWPVNLEIPSKLFQMLSSVNKILRNMSKTSPDKETVTTVCTVALE